MGSNLAISASGPMASNQIAVLGAGCFWGVQHYYDQVKGVVSTEVGYTGGTTDSPTYEQVCSHTTGHAEAVKIEFDPAIISFSQILKHFFGMHDPTQLNRQGWDIGDSYRSAIFYQDESQKNEAAKMIEELNGAEFKGKIVTSLEPAGKWWPAEAYHQKYAERTGRGMCHRPLQTVD